MGDAKPYGEQQDQNPHPLAENARRVGHPRIFSMIGSFQVFTSSFLTTAGGPNNATLTLVLYLYRKGFQYFQFGYASAIAWVMFVLVVVWTVLVLRSARAWVYYESDSDR